MQVGSIVKLKRDVQFDVEYLMRLALGAGVKYPPVHEKEYVVEEIQTEFCLNCQKDHTFISLDGVFSSELQPPQTVCVEEILKEPVKQVERIIGEGAESVDELEQVTVH
jgi:hypothetical protein